MVPPVALPHPQPLVADERLFAPPTWMTRTQEVRVIGTTVVVRPVLPGDVAPIADLVAGLSERSAYLRFHSPVRVLSPTQLAALVDVDHVERETIVALAPGRRRRFRGDGPPRLVGFGQYVAIGPAEVEVALLVADDWQGRGLGRVLAEALVSAATGEGYDTFRASVLAENRAALGLMRSLGFGADGISGGSALELVKHLRAPDAPEDDQRPDDAHAFRALAG